MVLSGRDSRHKGRGGWEKGGEGSFPGKHHKITEKNNSKKKNEKKKKGESLL